MAERKPAKKVAKKSAKSVQGFTDEERAVMRERAQEPAHHRVVVHIVQLLAKFSGGIYVEVVVTPLPEMAR